MNYKVDCSTDWKHESGDYFWNFVLFLDTLKCDWQSSRTRNKKYYNDFRLGLKFKSLGGSLYL